MKAKKIIFLDSFDHDGMEPPKKLRGAEADKHVLKTSKRVSIFWITENQARAVRITRWEKSGALELDNTSVGYPWLLVKKFNPEAA